MKWRLAGIFLLMGAAWATLTWMPQASLARISTILAEVRGGSLNERLNIWAAGLQVFATHPVLGVGAGTFSQAVEPILKEPRAPHNAFLAIAVEEGFVGLFLWLSLITLPFLKVLKFSPHKRWLWLVTLAILLIGFVSLNFEWRKVTWLMLAFAAAYSTRDILNPYLASREIV
jgi:O-antigen ligase